jgi:integrase
LARHNRECGSNFVEAPHIVSADRYDLPTEPESDALIFSGPDGSPISPDNLSRDWRRACRSLGLPMVAFHALRHTHASALIARGLDVVQISPPRPRLTRHHAPHLRASVQHSGRRRGGRYRERVPWTGRPVIGTLSWTIFGLFSRGDLLTY